MDGVFLSCVVVDRCLVSLRLWPVDQRGSSFVDLAALRTSSKRRRILHGLCVRPSSKNRSRPPDPMFVRSPLHPNLSPVTDYVGQPMKPYSPELSLSPMRLVKSSLKFFSSKSSLERDITASPYMKSLCEAEEVWSAGHEDLAGGNTLSDSQIHRLFCIWWMKLLGRIDWAWPNSIELENLAQFGKSPLRACQCLSSSTSDSISFWVKTLKFYGFFKNLVSITEWHRSGALILPSILLIIRESSLASRYVLGLMSRVAFTYSVWVGVKWNRAWLGKLCVRDQSECDNLAAESNVISIVRHFKFSGFFKNPVTFTIRLRSDYLYLYAFSTFIISRGLAFRRILGFMARVRLAWLVWIGDHQIGYCLMNLCVPLLYLEMRTIRLIILSSREDWLPVSQPKNLNSFWMRVLLSPFTDGAFLLTLSSLYEAIGIFYTSLFHRGNGILHVKWFHFPLLTKSQWHVIFSRASAHVVESRLTHSMLVSDPLSTIFLHSFIQTLVPIQLQRGNTHPQSL